MADALILGPRTIANLAFPTGIDGARLARWRSRDGITYQQLITELAQGAGALNQAMASEWGWLMYLTEEPEMEYPNGGTVSPLPELTDLSDPDMRHGTVSGHMVPLWVFGDRYGLSRRSMRDARMAHIRADIGNLLNEWRWRFEIEVLKRALTDTSIAEGSSGWNVGFANGNTNTSLGPVYTPPAYDGNDFTSSHAHYVGYPSGSYTKTEQLNDLVWKLREHGHMPPYIGLVPQTDVSDWKDEPDFIEPLPGLVDMVAATATTSQARFFSRNDMSGSYWYIGDFHSDWGVVRMMATSRIQDGSGNQSSGYLGVYKTMGDNLEGNPLVVRVHPDVGFGAYILAEPQNNPLHPIRELGIEAEFGVSVGMDRTKGAVGYRSSGGTWSNPTIA